LAKSYQSVGAPTPDNVLYQPLFGAVRRARRRQWSSGVIGP
jgi:hypothetical protein